MIAPWEAGPTSDVRPASPRRSDGAEADIVNAPTAPVAPTAPPWLDVLDETTRICGGYGRTDLVRRLRQRRAQLLDPQLRVLVVGAPKQGKSQLINALLNAPVCPVHDGAADGLTTVVQHAAAPAACLVRLAADQTGSPGRGGNDPDRAETRTPIPIERLIAGPPDLAAMAGRAAGGGGTGGAAGRNGADRVYAEIGLPRSLLAAGIALIEVPSAVFEHPENAAGAARPPNDLATNAVATVTDVTTLTRADTAIFVSDATAELSRGDLALLAALAAEYPDVVVALTKTDIALRWRAVLQRDQRLLADAGVPARVVPVSAALRLQAAGSGDAALNAESGFPQLVDLLLGAVSIKGDRFARSAVTLLGRGVLQELATPLNQELAALRGGEATDAMSRLHEAQRRGDELRRATGRWQNALGDEVADLLSDVEYEQREAARTMLRRVDELLDDVDPVRGWDEVREWVDNTLLSAAGQVCDSVVERLDAITERVAAPLDATVIPWAASQLEGVADRVTPIDRPPAEKFTLSQRLFSGLRGSYGGVLMFGLATSLAGLPLINPISLGAGAVFGGKSIFDDGKTARKRRQAVAKAAVQRHIDDVFLRLGKDVRDAIRHAQRSLRDQLATLTEELQASIVEFARTAKQAADSDAAVREHRAQRIQRELMRLGNLYEQARELSSTALPHAAASLPAQRRTAEPGAAGAAVPHVPAQRKASA